MSERLSDKAHRLIKEKIVTLEWPPAAMIDERALMRELDLGRTPVREALLLLAQEGLVTILPRRGMFVSDIHITDLHQIFEVRVALEGFCARLAAERITPDQIAEFEAVFSELDQVPETDINTLVHLDARFHHLLYRAAGNEFMIRTLTSLHALSLRIWYLAMDSSKEAWELARLHRLEFEAMKAGDGARAEQLIQDHIREFQQRLKAVL